MKRFRVQHSFSHYNEIRTTHVQANWFRTTWFTHRAIFYRGLRKVAWFVRTHSIVEEVAE